MRRLLLCGSLCALAVLAVGCEPETVSNPDYEAWVLFEPGSFVTFEGTRKIGDEAHPVRVTQKLVKKEAGLLLLERTTKMLDGADDAPVEIIRTTESATIAAVDSPLTHPDAAIEDLGPETIDVAGTSFDCEIKALKLDVLFPGLVPTSQSVTAQASRSSDMPGHTVKVHMVTETPLHRLEVSGQVVDFEAIRLEED